MLTDMIAAYVYAPTKKEKERAERNFRKLGIDKRTLLIMAAQVAEDMGVTPCHKKGAQIEVGKCGVKKAGSETLS